MDCIILGCVKRAMMEICDIVVKMGILDLVWMNALSVCHNMV